MTASTRPLYPSAKAVHSWSLFRTLGRFVARGSMPSGDLPEGGGGGLDLLELPAQLANRGYRSVQLCHFYLPSRDPSYLTDVRDAFSDADVELECLLIDDGDLTHPAEGQAHLDWISTWIDTADHLQPTRVRVPAGKQPPTAHTLATSAERLLQLADRHGNVRLVVENWHALLDGAGAVNAVLDQTAGRVGFLLDLGNWTGPGKYAELDAVAHRAETCQAKVTTNADGAIDQTDYRTGLTVLRDADYAGPLAMVYDGADPREWERLEQAYDIVQEIFPAPPPDADL